MSKPKMTYEESIHKMLEQVLMNQKTLLFGATGCKEAEERRIRETNALLEQVSP